MFARIKRLVKAGKWKIIGGWYLQPDCNMPSGESMLRQITEGNRFFEEEFGVKPETAVNFDSFGHSRGLVQILASAGYKYYMFMRPDKGTGMLEELPQYFTWEGYAGTSVNAFHLEALYSTQAGKVAADTRSYIENHPQDQVLMKTWGIGDHGGGPSRYEWKMLNDLIGECQGEIEFRHSDPDSYFHLRKAPEKNWDKSLNPIFIGCYSSMSTLKQGYRGLENMLYATEKLASAVSCQGLMEYPGEAFRQAEKVLLFLAFHDTLAGTISRIPQKEALHSVGFGMEILNRVRTRAFYAIASRQAPAQENSLPVFVYNPHPYPVEGIWECEYSLADYNWEDCSHKPRLYREGQEVPCQTERESGNVPVEYRKRVAFEAALAPMAMERFDLFLERVPVETKKAVLLTEAYRFTNPRMEVELDPHTGLISRYCVDGRELAEQEFGSFAVYEDNVDPWGMNLKHFGEKKGSFALSTPIRIVEDGAVRTVVEACFCYGHSEICVHYKLPKTGAYLEIDVIVYWREQDSLLRMEFPVPFEQPRYLGQTMFGVNRLEGNGDEQVCQKWAAVCSGEDCLTVINDGTYGLCCQGGLKLSLLRAPAYAAMPIADRTIIPKDRYTDRIDQGEHRFSFRIEGGRIIKRMDHVDLEAQVFGEKPHVLNIFPTISDGSSYQPPLEVEGGRLDAMTCCGEAYLLRVFNPHDREQEIRIRSAVFGAEKTDCFAPYQFKTYRLDKGKIRETDIFGGE